MDRCFACKGQTYFYGLQAHPVKARWVVCYDCRGVSGGTGSKNMYMFRTDDGLTGMTPVEPKAGMFKTGRDIEVKVDD